MRSIFCVTNEKRARMIYYSYDGCQYLSKLANQVNAPLSTINYLSGVLLNTFANVFMITFFHILTLIGLLSKKNQQSILRTRLEAIYIFTTQFAIGYFAFGKHSIYFFLVPIIIYGLFKCFPNQTTSFLANFSTFTMIFMLVLVSLTKNHIYRSNEDNEENFDQSREMHYSYILVNWCQKLSCYFCGLADGMAKKNDENGADERLDPRLQKTRIAERFEPPANVEFSKFIGYVYVNTLGGDLVFYNDYDQNLITSTKTPQARPQYGKFISKLIQAMIYGVTGNFITKQYPLLQLENPDFYQENSFLYVISYSWCSIYFGFRSVIYLVWNLQQANAALLNLDGTKYDLNKCLKSTNMIDITNSWNILVSKWLKLTVFERNNVKYRNSKIPVAFILTYVVSLIWHGVGANSICTFSLWFLASISTLRYRKKSWSYKYLNGRYFKNCIDGTETKWTRKFLYRLYYLGCWIYTQFGMAYFTMPYGMSTFSGIANFYHQTYYISIVPAFLAFVF